MADTRTPEELRGWLRLVIQHGLSRAAARHLLKQLGLPQHIFAASPAALARHVPQDLAARLSAAPEPDIRSALYNTIQMLSRPNHHLLTLADPGYPAALFDTGDPPLLLFVRGNPELLVQIGRASCREIRKQPEADDINEQRN